MRHPWSLSAHCWLRSIRVFLLALLAVPSTGLCAEVTLTWDANPESDLAGYTVYYGTAPGIYDTEIDVGNVTNFRFTNLNDHQTYYFAATAYDTTGNESGFSEEAIYAPPIDTDGDRITDSDESTIYGSDPFNTDTDGDGIADGEELYYWGENWNADIDGDTIINLLDSDADGDGGSDGAELAEGCDPSSSESTLPAAGLQLALAWKANTEPDVAGYKIYYGNASGSYDHHIDVSKQTSCVISGLDDSRRYYFAATAYDRSGNESEFSKEITYPTAPGSEPLPIEIRAVSVDHNWHSVAFIESFTDPVVVATPASYNGSHPGVVRIRNVTAAGFEIRLQEWDYLDGKHKLENVDCIVLERGRYELSDGTALEAGTFDASAASFTRKSFTESFARTPVVVAGITTVNHPEAVTGRLRNVNATGFELLLQEQEANLADHGVETVAFIAWEPSAGKIGDRTYEVGTTGHNVGDEPFSIQFHQAFASAPAFVAAMQSTEGGNTANLRYRNKTANGIEVMITEETSGDSETSHNNEAVGYILVGPSNLK